MSRIEGHQSPQSGPSIMIRNPAELILLFLVASSRETARTLDVPTFCTRKSIFKDTNDTHLHELKKPIGSKNKTDEL